MLFYILFFLLYNKFGDIMSLSNFNFKKRFGQNFLVDKNIVYKIVNSFKVLSNSLVIEIGCGDGRLTKELCKKFKYVLGYEIDLDVKERLLSNLNEFNNYIIHFDDFIKRDIVNDIKNIKYDKLYIVANLPYYITTPIIEKIIATGLDIENICIMVQKEVADRFSAKPGSKLYGSLSVYLNYYYDVKKLFDVNKNSFFPRPNVDSAVVLFSKKDEKMELINDDLFFKIIRDSFQFKRKTIKNNLKSYDLQKIEKVLLKYGYDLNVRAEYLSLEVFCDISNELSI